MVFAQTSHKLMLRQVTTSVKRENQTTETAAFFSMWPFNFVLASVMTVPECMDYGWRIMLLYHEKLFLRMASQAVKNSKTLQHKLNIKHPDSPMYSKAE